MAEYFGIFFGTSILHVSSLEYQLHVHSFLQEFRWKNSKLCFHKFKKKGMKDQYNACDDLHVKQLRY